MWVEQALHQFEANLMFIETAAGSVDSSAARGLLAHETRALERAGELDFERACYLGESSFRKEASTNAGLVTSVSDNRLAAACSPI